MVGSFIGILWMSRPPGFLKWLFWDFSGLRFIIGKINPPDKETLEAKAYKAPATFFIWFVGLYVAFFGVASQRYENNVDRVENRTNAVLALIIKDETRNNALGLVPKVQNMQIPIKPDILNPVDNVSSFFSLKSQGHEDSIEILKETVVGFRKDLSNANLTLVRLNWANLQEANLQQADLTNANLQDAKLQEVSLRDDTSSITGLRAIPAVPGLRRSSFTVQITIRLSRRSPLNGKRAVAALTQAKPQQADRAERAKGISILRMSTAMPGRISSNTTQAARSTPFYPMVMEPMRVTRQPKAREV